MASSGDTDGRGTLVAFGADVALAALDGELEGERNLGFVR